MPVSRVSSWAIQRRAGAGDDTLAVDEADYSAAGVPRDGSALLTQGIVPFQDTAGLCIESGRFLSVPPPPLVSVTGTQVEMILFAGAVYFVLV